MADISLIHLSNKIDNLIAILQIRPVESLKELYSALALAQGEFDVAHPSKDNPYYKTRYECLDDLVRASRPALAKNGLSVTWRQIVVPDSGSTLTCVLGHSTGQQIESSVRIFPSKDEDPRAAASEVEHYKRILYAGLVGVISSTEDDDAMMSILQLKGDGTVPSMHQPVAHSKATITIEQLQAINYEIGDCPDIGEQILRYYKLKYLADIPKESYTNIVSRIREIRALRESSKK